MLVFCAGMPRSGSTLQYNICKGLLGDRLTDDHGWVNEKRWERGWDPRTNAPNEVILLKCHLLPPWIDGTADSKDVRTLSSYRDLRDVVASGRAFRPDQSFDETLDFLELTARQLDRIETFPFHLVQRYEAMVEDLPGAVREIAAYLECAVDDDEVTRISERWSAGATRERAWREAPLGGLRRRWRLSRALKRGEIAPWYQPANQESLLRPDHISSSEGRPGRFRDVLTADEIDVIETRFGAWLRARSYL